MANLTSVLKEEITRLARKEIKSETETLKKAASQYRSEIAELKRRAGALEKQLSKLGKEVSRNIPPKAEPDLRKIRFVAKGFKSMREKLGVTAKEMSVLLDISAPTIYNWEAGISKPKQPQLIRIAHLRTMNKKEVADALLQLATPAPKAKVAKKPQPSNTPPKVAAKPAPKVAVKAVPKATVKLVPKAVVRAATTVVVRAATTVKKEPVAKAAIKQPAKQAQKAIVKPAPKAVKKFRVPKVITKPAEPVNQAAPKAVGKPRILKPKPAPISVPVTQASPDSQAEA